MIIAIMGIDGSGKTTIAKLLQEKLKETSREVKYRAEFDYIFLNHLLRFFFRNNLKQATRQYLKKEKSRPTYFKIWPYLVFLDCFICSLKFKLLESNKIVVCDRYFYDFIISFEELGDSNWFIRKLFLALPYPDIGFMLDVHSKIAYERKKDTHENNLEWFAMRREKYLDLNKILQFKLVNSEHSPDKTVNEMLKLINNK